MTTHTWPPHFQGTPLPCDSIVTAGRLRVPDDLPSFGQAWMEERFRMILWPPCKVLNRVRYVREFVWTDNGRTLHYRIIDLPRKDQ